MRSIKRATIWTEAVETAVNRHHVEPYHTRPPVEEPKGTVIPVDKTWEWWETPSTFVDHEWQDTALAEWQ